MIEKNRFWYEKESENWTDALPLGNGRMGAMVYGRAIKETIQIDESGFWSGEASEQNNRPGSRKLMDEIRRALLEENYEKADELGHGFIGNKNNYGTNMPVGNLTIELMGQDGKKVSDYKRYLDFENGIAETSFAIGAAHFVRTGFVSNPDQVCVIRFGNREKHPFSVKIRYDGIGSNVAIIGGCDDLYSAAGDARETLHSDGKCGVHMDGLICVIGGGKQTYEGESITVTDTKELILIIDLETDMFTKDTKVRCLERVEKARQKGYEELLRRHVEDVQSLFSRVDLSLGKEEKCLLPTDERIERVAEGEKDSALLAQMFLFGRYLLIASSREDSPLPTHMGGIWNDNIYNNIDCTQDMHIDMNIQMQYWLAAQCNLKECYQPVFRYIRDTLMPSGKKTAEEVYESKGWAAHVVSNPWGFTSLGWSYNWGVWSMGGVWCATLLWDYYEFTGELEFLKKEAFPIIKGAVEFVLDYMFYDEKSGYYMTGPSYSPENQFSSNGRDYFLSLSTTCDVVLVRAILAIFLKMMNRMQGETKDDAEEMTEKAKEVLEKLPPHQIGEKGQIQEWFHDFEEPIPNHRHTSHLLGVYPFAQLDLKDEKWADAVRKSIELRYDDFEITSWGMNMLMNYYVRLGDGGEALQILKDTFRRLVKTNMASVMSDETSMWCGTWELDGNTGICAAIAEMLLQSHEETVHLLPALPEEWDTGYVKGLAARGGLFADISWSQGNLSEVTITSDKDCEVRFTYKEKEKTVNISKGIQKFMWSEV